MIKHRVVNDNNSFAQISLKQFWWRFKTKHAQASSFIIMKVCQDIQVEMKSMDHSAELLFNFPSLLNLYPLILRHRMQGECNFILYDCYHVKGYNDCYQYPYQSEPLFTISTPPQTLIAGGSTNSPGDTRSSF